MITLKAAQTTYIADYGRGENRQPMTSYALGGCHQGNGLANDALTLQRRPQFGAICCVIATALASAVVKSGNFETALKSKNEFALLEAIGETFENIPKSLAGDMIAVIKDHTEGFKTLIANLSKQDQKDDDITKALKTKEALWAWLKKEGHLSS